MYCKTNNSVIRDLFLSNPKNGVILLMGGNQRGGEKFAERKEITGQNCVFKPTAVNDYMIFFRF